MMHESKGQCIGKALIHVYPNLATSRVVSGFLLVRLCALAHHLEVCASVMGRTKRACHLHLILRAWDAVRSYQFDLLIHESGDSIFRKRDL